MEPWSGKLGQWMEKDIINHIRYKVENILSPVKSAIQQRICQEVSQIDFKGNHQGYSQRGVHQSQQTRQVLDTNYP